MCVQKMVSKMCVQKKKVKLSKSPDIKISLHGRSQKCVFKKMKLSKSPDIKIFQHERSQKCVFKKMKFSKSPESKFLFIEGLKNVCSKK